ncbi:metallophosphoesterase family protein [Fictibacillus fluitans]|uniref:Phosphoesterase n=1 Tax=Fictibacillus fluitans TaxID=3058422 RepID=A0ABT8HQ28_9BACL|nr:metallophosphoesterase family protein [Fictibacillus sp. NE201]MDN4522866.1 metallophosphoesterase family protein [Fictibacillus sp. NE201]
MKIVVLSDTHMPKKAKKLPERLIADLNTADLIIHAGDWQSPEVLHQLQQYAPVEGVTGNVDGPEMKELFNERFLLKIEQFTIGVVHGHGTKQTTEKRAIAAFNDTEVDCIIFGHSHIPKNYRKDGVLLFNPGSPTDKRREKQFSHGILTIDDQLIANHVFYDDKN